MFKEFPYVILPFFFYFETLAKKKTRMRKYVFADYKGRLLVELYKLTYMAMTII